MKNDFIGGNYTQIRELAKKGEHSAQSSYFMALKAMGSVKNEKLVLRN
ncbi:MAG: hypothetical protein ACM3MG_02360 [Bacillota bacterium]